MRKASLIFVTAIDKLSIFCGNLARMAIFALIAVMLYEVIARYFLGAPTSWSNELAAIIFGFYFLIGSGYTLLKGGHVRMDILYAKWSSRRKAWVNVLTFFLVGIYLATFLFGGWETLLWGFKFKQRSMSQWAPPLWPIYLMTLIGAFILLLQSIAQFIRDLFLAVTGEPIDK